MSWKKNQLVWIEADQGLGVAKIVDDSQSSFFKVLLLNSGEKRLYTKKKPPFKRVHLQAGQKVVVAGEKAERVIDRVAVQDDLYFFRSEQQNYSEADIAQVHLTPGVTGLLAQQKFSEPSAFHLRRQACALRQLREDHPLKGAAGCRVLLMPHQLWVVQSALEMGRVRAFLADEVGLGKTIEAGLIFSALHAREQLKKVLILVPEALKVQWLTECYRRFNERFRLDHEELIEEEEHRDFVIASMESLEKNNVEDLDLLIVDESHRLMHDPLLAESLTQMVSRARHVLFLSATPRVHGDAEFLRTMKTLGRVENGLPVVPRLFQSKRSELNLPTFRKLKEVKVKNKKKWLIDFLRDKLSSKTKEKVFLIGSQTKTIKDLCNQLRTELGQNFALFHDEMDLVERDRQAAYFADPEGAQFLISSEIGGEGRNFQFCQHLVMLDLPADPLVIEQRIGRLDRLGQVSEVSVWCPVDEDSSEAFHKLNEVYGVFDKPWSGSGLEDTQEKDLLKSSKDAPSNSLLALEKTGTFVKANYDSTLGKKLLDSVSALTSVDIQPFLESLYDVFGVDVEDFDTLGNWRVSSSSLMFVDHFPGLGETGERILSFRRADALAREDMTLFTLDHPEFIESIDFLLNSDQGKLSLAHAPKGVAPDLYFLALMKAPEEFKLREKMWSFTKKAVIPVKAEFLQPLAILKSEKLPENLLQGLPGAVEEFLDVLDRFAAKQGLPKGSQVESLMVILPAS